MDIPKGVTVKETFSFDIYRKAVAYKTSESWRTVPHAVLCFELDVTEVLAFVAELKKDPAYADVSITINTVMLKVIAEGLKASPHLNAHVEYNPKNTLGEIAVFEDINIAMPFITNDGHTVTPVLRQVGARSLKQLSADMVDMRRRVANTNFELLLLATAQRNTRQKLRRGRLGVLRRVYANLYGPKRLHFPPRSERKAYQQIPEKDRLTPDNLLSATTLVTNIGSVMPKLNTHLTLLEVIPPQVTAFGLCAARKQPVVVEDEQGNDSVAIRRIMPLTMAADHRAVDFTHVTGFAERITELCKNPRELLEDPS